MKGLGNMEDIFEEALRPKPVRKIDEAQILRLENAVGKHLYGEDGGYCGVIKDVVYHIFLGEMTGVTLELKLKKLKSEKGFKVKIG